MKVAIEVEVHAGKMLQVIVAVTAVTKRALSMLRKRSY